MCTSGVKDEEGYYRVDGGALPVICTGNFDTSCNTNEVTAANGNTVCSDQPIWGNANTPWRTVAGYQAQAARWADADLAPKDWWLFPIEDPTGAVTQCDDPTLVTSSKYAFLHIYYATPQVRLS